MALAVEGGLNPGDRVWVGQLERRQQAAAAAAACATTDRCAVDVVGAIKGGALKAVDSVIAGALFACNRVSSSQWRLGCLGVVTTVSSINVYTQVFVNPRLSTAGKAAAFNVATACLLAGGKPTAAGRKKCTRIAFAIGLGATAFERRLGE